MAVQSIEEEARAYVKQYYRIADGDFGNYRCDLIAGLLGVIDERRANIEGLLIEIRERLARAKEDLADADAAGDIRTPRFNRAFARHDALDDLLEWVEDR